jgi:hypothetical protein
VNGAERAVQELGTERQAGVQRVTKKRLVDSLNSLNFREDPVTVHLEHVRYGTLLFLRAYPQPCTGDLLECTWAEPAPANIATSYTVRNFLVDRGLDLLIVDAQVREMTPAGITFVLPEECRGHRLRRAKRYASEGIRVTLMQDATTCSGMLDDFTTDSFRVIVSIQPPQTFDWINDKAPLYAVFSDGSTVLFTGECRITRQTESKHERVLVLEPVYGEDLKPREGRFNSEGHLLVPRPGVAFNHPLARKRMSLEVDEISPCWFSVTEYYESSALFAGLVLPQVELEVAPGFSLTCVAQVSRGEVHEAEGEKTVKWWIVVLDMGIEDQGKLFALLQRAQRSTSHVNGKVDLEDLLTFFFDAGFVYPEKYATLYARKERFLATYKKLYLENPAIARHFIQMDKGVIQGHLSMVRLYENTWMLHHHAAIGQNGAGLRVLNQARDYVNDFRCLRSSHLDYLICYFRPNNKFPNRVFGGFARALSNPKHCSIDAFAYLNLNFNGHGGGEAEEESSWKLDAAKPEDLEELSNFYEYTSGGLMLKALNLGPDEKNPSALNGEYEKLGFRRETHLYALKKDGVLKALALAVVSDIGLNLSNLTNCVHVFVVDGEDLPADLLYRHLAALSPHYTEDQIPLLLYPLSYAEQQSIPCEKMYDLWAFDTKYAGSFYDYMDRMLSGKRGAERDRKTVRGIVRLLEPPLAAPPE